MLTLARLMRRPSAWQGSLAYLSLTHCRRHAPVPAPPDNHERYRAFRNVFRAPLGNSQLWKWDAELPSPTSAKNGITSPGA